ncbi:MAG: hypothetical protein HFG49_14555 [Lachnospiraceae bacterium]|nr:hypothetical protein [Lachnospiraceae bacterium]
MFLAMAIYGYTLKIIRSQAEEMNGNLLIMVQKEFDYELESMKKIAIRMALDDQLQILSNMKGEFSPAAQMDLYHVFEECQVVNTSEDFISDIFIVFNNTQKIVSSRGNMSDILFYDMYYKSDEVSYLQFKNYMNEYHDGDILSFYTLDGRQTLLFVTTSIKSNYGDQASAICFEIDCSALKNRLAGMKWASLMDVCILTSNNMKLCTDETISGLYEWNYDSQEEGNLEITDQSGENYIVSVLKSDLAEWKYLSIMSIREMEEQAGKLQKLAMIGLFLCTITGIFTAIYITKRNYHPIKLLLETFKSHRQEEIKEGENEYLWLNSQMDQFFKQHIDTELLLKKNQKNLKSYYLYQLLQNNYDGKSLEQYDLQIRGHYNIVLLLIPWKAEQGLPGNLEENALQKFAVMNVFEELCLDYYNLEMVELGEQVAAIVSVPDDQREHLDIIKNLSENLQQIMEGSLQFSFIILCSNICQGWEGIHAAYQQAIELEKYVHLLDTTLLFYDDVKNIQPKYTYPLEYEQKIINGIRVGNSSFMTY